MTKNLIKGSNIIIFVYDITRRETFLELNYWVNMAKKEIEKDKVIFGILANKIDLFYKSEVEKEEGEKFADSIGAFFFEGSMEHILGINNFLEYLLEKLLLLNDTIIKENAREINENFYLEKVKKIKKDRDTKKDRDIKKDREIKNIKGKIKEVKKKYKNSNYIYKYDLNKYYNI